MSYNVGKEGGMNMFCSNCGRQVADNSMFCSGCGAPTPLNRGCAPYVQRDKWIAFVLCLFLGCIGAHRFYVGKIGSGILWLFTAGFCGIGALVDLILILCDSFRDDHDMPLKG